MARNQGNPSGGLADGSRYGLKRFSSGRMKTNSSSLGWGGVIAAAILVGGCEAPLFPAETARTPYERYQQLHGEQRSGTEENAYGGQQPALRDRLRPLNQD